MKTKQILLVVLSVLLFSCALPPYQAKIAYYNQENNFKFLFYSDFDKCSRVGIKAFSDSNMFFESWERGGGKDVSFFVSDKIMREGDNVFKIYCDDKEYQQPVVVKNSKYKIMNAIYAKSDNVYEIASKNQNVFKEEAFYNEFKNYLLASKQNYDQAKDLINFMPSYFKARIYKEIVERYNDNIVLKNVVAELRNLLFEEKSEDIILALFSKNIAEFDADAASVIFSKPVNRYFDKFFPLMITKPATFPIIIEHLEYNDSTEFSQSVFRYIKDQLEKGETNNFTKAAFDVWKKKTADKDAYITYLLFSGDPKKEQLALEIYKKSGFDKTILLAIKENWDKLGVSSKDMLFPEVLEECGDDILFFKRFINNEKPEIKNILYKVGLNLKERYTDSDVVNFYLSSNDRGAVYQYFLSAPNDIKVKGLSKFYEADKKDITILVDLKEIAPKYVAQQLIENFLVKDGEHIVIAASILADFGELYLNELIKAYETESNLEKRHAILSNIARVWEKGTRYAYDKVKTVPFQESLKDVYKNIAKYAEGDVLEDILKNINDLTDDVFISVSIGFEEAKKKIQCDFLTDRFHKSKEQEAIFRVIWTWAYCCPDSYFEMFKSLKDQMSELVFIEAIDGVRDIIKDVKPLLKDSAFLFIKEIYPSRKIRTVREKIVDVIIDAGDKSQLNFLKELSKDAESEEEKIFFEERIQTFINEKGAKE